MNDQDFIRRTFELAKKGLGSTWPNPLVGAVIVKDGKIISEGFHSKQGQAHAELDAIQNAKESIRGSTIYVNLEPCCHTNKTTPPCAQRLIAEGFAKVVICNLDPNPSVNGKGVELLKSNGVEVEVGILKEEGEILNEVFFLSQTLRRPFIHFKSASTFDGKTALPSGESQWITGEAARLHVHKLRALHQGIIVGGETLRRDNPKLTVRISGYEGPQPHRIVFTRSGILPSTHHLFSDEYKKQTLIYTEKDLSINFPSNQVIKIQDITEALTDLQSKKIISLLMESGPGLASEFMKRGFIDRFSLYQNPSFLGEGHGIFQNLGVKNLNERPRLHKMESSWLGDDLYLTGRVLKG